MTEFTLLLFPLRSILSLMIPYLKAPIYNKYLTMQRLSTRWANNNIFSYKSIVQLKWIKVQLNLSINPIFIIFGTYLSEDYIVCTFLDLYFDLVYDFERLLYCFSLFFKYIFCYFHFYFRNEYVYVVHAFLKSCLPINFFISMFYCIFLHRCYTILYLNILFHLGLRLSANDLPMTATPRPIEHFLSRCSRAHEKLFLVSLPLT